MSDTGTPFPAVSLFSNCGAGDLGYANAGFAFDVLAELDPRRLDVAGLNLSDATLVPGDLRVTWPDVVSAYRTRQGLRSPALLAACPPCQGMSSARGGRGREDDPDAGSRDARNLLVEVIASVAHALAPRVVVVENVPAFFRRQVRHPRTGAPISAAVLLARSLRGKYELHPMEADLADYGVPQSRKRAFMCFLRRGDEVVRWFAERGRAPFPRPTHATDYGARPLTLRQALDELGAGSLDAGDSARAGKGLHAVPVWDPARYAMVAAIPAGAGASAWDNDRCPSCGLVTPKDMASCPACEARLNRPSVIDLDGGARLIKGFQSSSYTRMHPDRPASTVTTASGHIGSDRTLHPFENRVLSIRECQHLQTFPADFQWGDALERWGHSNVRAMVGEAVPPQFTSMHGEVLVGALTGEPVRAAIVASDERMMRARQRLAAAARAQ